MWFPPEKCAIVHQEIEDLLSKGAIRPVSPSPGQFVSRLFTVPKKGTTAERPVIDLRHLNEHVRYEHFQMEGLHLVPLSVREGNWLTKLDLKDAYFTVPIHPQHRRLLRFSWEGQLYEFQCLPFGLSSAPRVFTKLMKVPISVLRRQGIRLILYLDDLLLIAESRPAAVLQTQQAIQLLESLGFVINRKKSIPEPTQQLEFLGFQLNSVAMTMSVPIDKARKLQQECHRALSQPYLSIRALASLLGRMVACSPGMFLAPLQFRHLQQLKIAALRRHQSYLATVRLTPEARTELTWWAADLETWNGRSILKPPAQLTIFSDASLLGWGAVCGTTSTGGQWSPTEANLHINALELIAASFAVKAFHHRASYRPLHIKLLIDNTTAVSYINRLGGTHSRLLSQIACDLWRWAVQHDIRLQAEYVPSEENPADHPSRGSLSESGDWRLDPALFRRIQRAAPWTLVLDLFASRLNTQLPAFYAWRPDPEALALDAFSQNWSLPHQDAVYAFPPFCLLDRVLHRVASLHTCRMILVAPVWDTQPWYATLLQLLVDFPMLLPTFDCLLLSPSGHPHPLVLSRHLRLAAWPISSSASMQQDFLHRSCDSSPPLGGHQPMPLTHRHGSSGWAGAVNGQWIPFAHL
ncbi:uncharacterized protein LOC135804633 [Sycon ciliatum]|uniref:uncharacterized protein LOC135804633 n=1 Tax=Sycon ciliatum TaxID=27933 RepID=UPI0031F61791